MAYLGSGVLPAGGAGRPVFAEADEVSVRADVSGVGGYLYQAWAEENEQLIEAAERAGEQADQFKKDGKADEARAVWAWACLLASAVGDGDRAEAFLEKLAETDEALVTAWEQAVPALALKLDIELRHATLAEALKTVGAAARVSVELLPGSVEDASALLERQDLSIAYLDLRRATLAQALDWILRPVRLSWWIDGGRVVAGSVRRGPGLSAWVYDVSRIAPPDGEDLNAIRDYRERVKKAGRDAEKFVKLLCGALNLPRERVSWYAPGRLVIFATADVHARAAALLRALSEKGSEVPADLKALHAETVRRAEARQPLYEKSVAELERARLVHTLRDAGWRVAAAAAGEEPDVEALCELTAAWRAPGTGALLAEGHPAAFRAAWAFVRAAREHPDEQGLAEIAAQAVARMGSSADAVLAGFQKERADAGKFVSALYAALSLGDESPFRQTAIPVLTDRRLGGGELGAWRRIAAALLQPGQEASTEGLLSLLAETGAINGEDMVALGALACRRAAGEPWRRMRAEAREILGRQPLSGAVVVLVNRLDAAAR